MDIFADLFSVIKINNRRGTEYSPYVSPDGKYFFICILGITRQTQGLRETIDNINPFSEKYTSFIGQDLNRSRQDASRAYQEKDYVLAAKLYLYILNYDYNDFTSLYNLACCYGLLEHPVLAAEFLARAISAILLRKLFSLFLLFY